LYFLAVIKKQVCVQLPTYADSDTAHIRPLLLLSDVQQ